jgi:hypothetical protein
MATVKRIIVVLPGAMVARNWLSTGLLERLAREPDLAVTLVTADDKDADVARRLGLAWEPMLRASGGLRTLQWRVKASYLLHLASVFRFNAIQRFRGAQQRLRQSRRLRGLALRDGVPAYAIFGWPFATSSSALSALLSLQKSLWRTCAPVARLFDRTDPALLVIGHMQNSFVLPYVLAAKARGIPVLGAIGSWDQPTTKGPLVVHADRILAQSRSVAGQLQRYHGVEPERVEVTGWLQMDPLVRPPTVSDRSDLLRSLGLSPRHRYILLGSSPERLGHNEPTIARDLAATLPRQADCSLVIRAHPNDRNWRERFGSLHAPPHVVVLGPELANMERMADQIRHAHAVLSPAGSILLDSAALDRPAIALAFENEDEPYDDRLARRYEMEHWAELIDSGGVLMARTQADLERLVNEALDDPGLGAEGRIRLRENHLAPLDGAVAERTVAAIRKAAGLEASVT